MRLSGFAAVLAVLVAFVTPVAATPGPVPAGVVTINNHAFSDDNGLFEGFGASFFWALWGQRADRVRVQQNLDWLGRRGVNYIRILSMVGAQPYWRDRVINPKRKGYFTTFDQLVVDATVRGIRLQVVLFADAQVMMPSQSARRAWLYTMAAYLERHRAAVQFVEIANESGLNGVNDSDLAELTNRWQGISDIPVAPSSPADSAAQVGIERLFSGQKLTADLLTPHFDRDQREEGYGPHRQPWRAQFYDGVTTPAFVNNEGIGPGSRSGSDSDPARLAMGMLNTFVSGGAGYVFHSRAGVRGDYDFWQEDNAEAIMTAFRGIIALVPRNIANGQNCNHHWGGHPYVDLNQIWPDTGGDGVVRAFASEVDGLFYVAVMGMRNSYQVTAKWPMTVEVFDSRDATGLEVVELSAGQDHTFWQHGHLRDYVHRISQR